jgi:hypothetical protein
MITQQDSMKRRFEVPQVKKEWVDFFCIECGDQLEDFCFSSEAADVRAIRKRFEECKTNGRFKGGFCAKLFIAAPEALETIHTEKSEEVREVTLHSVDPR